MQTLKIYFIENNADFKIYTGTQNPTAQQKSENFEFTQLIKQKIEQEIIDKGFNFTPEAGLEETQYQVVALAVADDNFTSSEYLNLFQLFPELGNDSDLKKGTLIVGQLSETIFKTNNSLTQA